MEKLLKRFIDKILISEDSDCWIWKPCLYENKTGKKRKRYGALSVRNKQVSAHRISYHLFYKENPFEYNVLHKCDNTFCVNPNHLELGTQKENMRQAKERGRNFFSKKTHCKRGHEFNSENTGMYKSRPGARFCKICKKMSDNSNNAKRPIGHWRTYQKKRNIRGF